MGHNAPKLGMVKAQNPYRRPTPTSREGIFAEQRPIGGKTTAKQPPNNNKYTTNPRLDNGKFMTSNPAAEKCNGSTHDENDRGDKGRLHSWFYVSNVYSYLIAVVWGGE